MPDRPAFESRQAMLSYMEKKKQDLINLRVFKTVKTELIPLEEGKDFPRRYALTVEVVNAWTFFPLLVPTFDTNDDLTLKMKVSYGNFFGTLTQLTVDGDFSISQNPVSKDLEFKYWTLESSLDKVRIRGMDFTFSWLQSHERKIRKEGTETVEFYSFDKTDFFITSTFDLGQDYYYTLGPAFEFTYNYKDQLSKAEDYILKEPQSYGLIQKFGLNRVDWKGNFKEGYAWEAYLKGRMVWNNEKDIKGLLILSAGQYGIFNERMAWGIRSLGVLGLDDKIYKLGEYMRGVGDFELTGYSGLFFNSSFPLLVTRWEGVAEGQIAPFVDAGIIFPVTGNFFPRDHMRMSVGMDFLCFPEKITSVQLRISLGYDLFGPLPPEKRYEILISTSLFF